MLGMVGLGLSSVLPGDYASQLSALQALGVSGFPIKLLLTVPLSYHTWNGIRHLVLIALSLFIPTVKNSVWEM